LTVDPGATVEVDAVNDIASTALANGPSMITPKVKRKIIEARASIRRFMLTQLRKQSAQKLSASKVFPNYPTEFADSHHSTTLAIIFTLNKGF
jgi:hypothetical protein